MILEDKNTGKIYEPGEEAIKYCIDCGIKVGKYITDNYLNEDFKRI